MPRYTLAIDQGTTSSRAILFDKGLRAVAVSQKEFQQIFPASGWVEHDPEDIWESVLETCRDALGKISAEARDVAAIGLTNQRETVVVWDRKTGKPVYNAIVWQDRRTSESCSNLKGDGLEPMVAEKTGLLLDPYFSATKITWILDHCDGAREMAERGELAFGTIDCFLMWRLSGGRAHVTDATNASRTLLYNIHRGNWDDELLDLFGIPRNLLPDVLDCAAPFCETDAALFGGSISVRGVAGDQQAAAIGQACFRPGMVKSTYGTGCFAVLNTGETPVRSQNRLLTTIAYQLDGCVTYALEGSIFVAGATVQWLRDGLGVITSAAETASLAKAADPTQDVYLVPAFTGLGAPYWDADARGALFGLTRATGPEELARACLESVCYQTRDLLDAMRENWGEEEGPGNVLRVDGGMVNSDWMLQFLSDILNAQVDRPQVLETTALGAACLAGIQAGNYPDLRAFSEAWKLQKRFSPVMPEDERARKYAGWQDAVKRTLSA